jgi:peptidoglycan hydrolase CwlO-like protein
MYKQKQKELKRQKQEKEKCFANLKEWEDSRWCNLPKLR